MGGMPHGYSPLLWSYRRTYPARPRSSGFSAWAAVEREAERGSLQLMSADLAERCGRQRLHDLQ
jgi:hypothetical protein